MTSIYRALASSTTPNAISKGVSKPRVTPDSYRSTLSLRDNHVRVFSSRVTPDSYHPTLSLCDNLTVCFHLGQHNSSAYTSSLLHLHRNFGYLHGSLTPLQKFRISPRSLTPTQKFWITPRVSYTLTEISDYSTCLLHPHINFGTSPRVSYTHTEIWDTSQGLLHPHINSGSLPGSLTPTQLGIKAKVNDYLGSSVDVELRYTST